ncbi:hypothetical protein ACFQ1E_07760 [Sphingomonas canadensis]|jgi:hypothetical protein|uniref:DUF4864 domain-containing protein n=1 Tax=Sphingomonas canadensis TaxID=1219257 RepID=A0ABW3H409_9SPHN|nr:hypothetical protein [Sphingomonas canadensis]MCW3835931.1 hypothetical protein [Sphingomonas canadensis]
MNPALLIAPIAIVAAVQGVTDVGVGNPLRKTLLDALRPTIQKDLGQPVKFVVDQLRAKGDWAFAIVHPQTPAGKPIDFTKTRYAEEIREGFFDGDTTIALLKREKGKWKVKAFVIGPTDVAWEPWPGEYGAPRDLLMLDGY